MRAVGNDWSERPSPGADSDARTTRVRGPTDSPQLDARERSPEAILALQRAAGNQAVGRILARQKKPKQAKQSTRSGFRGDGKHLPTDAGYASEIGKADAALLKTAKGLSDEQRADIKSKLGWFQAGARGVYLAQVDPPLVQIGRPASDIDPTVQTDYILARGRQERLVEHGYGSIQKFKTVNIDTWEKNADLPESKLGLEVLEFVVAVVSEGLGGVVLKVIDDALAQRAGKYVKEFAALAGLEATDYALESAYHTAVTRARADIEIGLKNCQDAKVIGKVCKDALVSKGGTRAAYAEALRKHTIREEDEMVTQFNTTDAKKLSDDEVVQKIAGLQTIEDALGEHPDEYMRELTNGYLTMLDEAMLREEDKDYGGDRARTFGESRKAHDSWFRAGNLVISAPQDLGSWASPDLSFSEFKATGGGLNPDTLDYLKGAEIQELKMTLSFEFGAVDPYPHALSGEGWVPIHFVRDRDGRIFLDGPKAMDEWLASYHDHNPFEHSKAERDRHAPLGAAKLYEAIKDKRIGDVEQIKKV
jgi:hypothetical protein